MFKYYLYILARRVLLKLPLSLVYKIANFFGKLSYKLNTSGRKKVYQNLSQVFPEKSEDELKPIVVNNFVNFTKYLVDFLRAEKLTDDFLHTRVNFIDDAVLNDFKKCGKNFIVLTAHIGNWELGGGVLALRGFEMAAVAKPHLNEATNRFFDKQRDFLGMEVIPLGIALRRCFKVLKEGKVLALLGDKEFGNGGLKMKMCSANVIIPKGPAVMGLKFSLPLLPAFMVRNSKDNYDFHVEKPIYPVDSDGEKKTEEEIAAAYSKVIEKYIRKYPDQWFMFEPYFEESNV